MSSGVKSTLVIAGLFAFCLIPIVGPVLGVAGDTVVQAAASIDDETAVEHRKKLVDPAYKNGTLQKAVECCVACNVDWDYLSDRCSVATQLETKCYATCGSDNKGR
jgi:hypothetical protein